MTKSEFIDLIENGGDIMFDCLDKHYTILTWTDDGIFIGEQITETQKEEISEYFNSAEDLVANFKVHGIPLGELIDEVNVTFCN
ncbi:MAG: hypothetical protein Q4D35_03090 [Ruminococcus sp.]|nr:hypothetical protein [Ruminococcus sp.]